MKLYGYFRSSASYRVRIALNLKGLNAAQIPVNLLKGEQKSDAYKKVNPQGLVPALITDSGVVLTQSMAIIEYLEETHPGNPALLPKDAEGRARVRAISQAIACEIAPINNLAIQRYLVDKFGADEAAKTAWIQHWITSGFDAVETMLQDGKAGVFCHGDTPSMADCCLIPQIFNASRFNCSLMPYPTIRRIYEAAEAHPAFQAAHPSKQPDATS